MRDARERDRVIILLKENGVTPTHQRVEIGRVLFARAQHLSADQVLEMVNQIGVNVSKATIYNTLNLFARKAMVREVIVDPSRVFYDSNTEAHHHVFNMDTGELTDIPTDELALGVLPPMPPGTVAVDVDVIIRVRSVRHIGYAGR